MACSCATGSPFGQAAVLGVPLAPIGGDGRFGRRREHRDGLRRRTASASLCRCSYALEKNALLVYQVNGEELKAATGGIQQPVDARDRGALLHAKHRKHRADAARTRSPTCSWSTRATATRSTSRTTRTDCVFKAGDEITFEGVADDLGSPIAAIEFSFDNGRTWTPCDTDGATADKWVNWQFTTSFEEGGDYRMTVRAKNCRRHGSPACGDAAVPGLVGRAYRRAQSGAPLSGVRLQFGNGFMGRVKPAYDLYFLPFDRLRKEGSLSA